MWNDLKLQYGGLAYCLSSQVAVLINDKILGGEKELKELIDTKYTYHLVLDYCKESIKQFASYVNGSYVSFYPLIIVTCLYLNIPMTLPRSNYPLSVVRYLSIWKLKLSIFLQRPCAYMHISINTKHIGTMIFMVSYNGVYYF